MQRSSTLIKEQNLSPRCDIVSSYRRRVERDIPVDVAGKHAKIFFTAKRLRKAATHTNLLPVPNYRPFKHSLTRMWWLCQVKTSSTGNPC
ncbi:Uncharacterised protein [Enterobacter hormaechei]|nr:Uncharacterised protein [Enterobacter hormaechei]